MSNPLLREKALRQGLKQEGNQIVWVGGDRFLGDLSSTKANGAQARVQICMSMEKRTREMLQKHLNNVTGAAATVLTAETTYEEFQAKVLQNALAYFVAKFNEEKTYKKVRTGEETENLRRKHREIGEEVVECANRKFNGQLATAPDALTE